jgi:hypothetical protein
MGYEIIMQGLMTDTTRERWTPNIDYNWGCGDNVGKVGMGFID